MDASLASWRPAPSRHTIWELLEETHRALRDTVATLGENDLARNVGSYPLAELIAGAAAHDRYHAGQIQLMKRLAAEPALAPHR